VTWDGRTTLVANKEYLMDIENGNMYFNTENNQLGILDSYKIKYFVTPNFTVTEGGSATRVAPTGETYTSTDFSYSALSTTASKVIVSQLTNPVDLKATMTLSNCSNLQSVSFTSNTGTVTSPTYTCSGTTLIANLDNVEQGTNTVTITYRLREDSDAICKSFFGSFSVLGNTFATLLTLVGITLVMGILAVVLYYSNMDNSPSVGSLGSINTGLGTRIIQGIAVVVVLSIIMIMIVSVACQI
jgi:hypothetical protein